MIILTTQFDGPVRTNYKILLDVFKKSIKTHMPEAEYRELILEAPDKVLGHKYGITSNSFKLAKWVEFLEGCEDNVIFADCDMLMVSSAKRAFEHEFDIAYTRRSRSVHIPINCGIIMVRPNERSRAFFREWLRINDLMYEDASFHKPWRDKYHGINQAAFGYMLEKGNHEASLYVYETRDWNAVDCDWPYINDNTVFVHIKGALRDVIYGASPRGPKAKAMELWYQEAGLMPKRRGKPTESKKRTIAFDRLALARGVN
jgi:hypothetical protein